MNKLTNWLYNYSYENWKFTPKSQKVMYGAVSILAVGVLGAFIISKKK